MRHLHAGNKLGVSPHHRKALIRSLTLALVERNRIQTTPARAKTIRPFAERLVTLAKRGDLHSRRRMVQLLGSTQTNHQHNRVRNAIHRIYSDLVPRFKSRNGGYTQIFRFAGGRAGDYAPQCLIQYIPGPEESSKKKGPKKSKEPPREAKAQGDSRPIKEPKRQAAAPKDAGAILKHAGSETSNRPADQRNDKQDKNSKTKKEK